MIVPPSGRLEARWCQSCAGPVCMKPDCLDCIPTDLLLENIEKGRPLNFRPIVASVPRVLD